MIGNISRIIHADATWLIILSILFVAFNSIH
jgi:hypothetical protein